MKAFIVFLALLALASARRPAVRAPLKPYIIGGEDAGETEFPYQVDIQVYSENYCSGAIYDELRIVTSGYCADGLLGDFRGVEVMAGATDIKNLRGTEQVRNIAKVEIHEAMDGNTYDYDIAIITLTEPLMFNQRVQPIRLAIPTIEASGEGISTGWGVNTTDSFDSVAKLQKVTLDIMERETCARNYGSLVEITPNMLCASAPGKAACIGDFGGPLSVKDEANRPYLAGLWSFGILPCTDSRYPSVYVNIANVRGWLESKLNP